MICCCLVIMQPAWPGRFVLKSSFSLQVDEAKDETDSGLLLTSASKEQPTIGKVCTSTAVPKAVALNSLSCLVCLMAQINSSGPCELMLQ